MQCCRESVQIGLVQIVQGLHEVSAMSKSRLRCRWHAPRLYSSEQLPSCVALRPELHSSACSSFHDSIPQIHTHVLRSYNATLSVAARNKRSALDTYLARPARIRVIRYTPHLDLSTPIKSDLLLYSTALTVKAYGIHALNRISIANPLIKNGHSSLRLGHTLNL